MRSYTTFRFDDHAQYLRRMQDVLRSLSGEGIHITAVVFDPGLYAEYCANSGQDPDSATARTRYTAEVAAAGAGVAYCGQPVEELLSQLSAEAGRQANWEHATAVLAEAGACRDCGDDHADAAFDRASLALTRLIESVGKGAHHLVCSVPVDGVPLSAVLHADYDETGTIRIAEAEALVFCTVLAAGILTRSPGGVVLRTGGGKLGEPDRVRGWQLRDAWLHPLTEAQVFNAYCTDATTGEPVPPEPGVDYHPGTSLPPPEEGGL
jgi:hypothetical protein